MSLTSKTQAALSLVFYVGEKRSE